MYRPDTHKQKLQTSKLPHRPIAHSVFSSRPSGRLILSILLTGPILAAGIMAVVYAVVAPDVHDTVAPSAVANQKARVQSDAAPQPIKVRINGRDVPLSEPGRYTGDVPLQNGAASVTIQSETPAAPTAPDSPTSPSASDSPKAPEQPDNNASDSLNQSNLDVHVNARDGHVKVDVNHSAQSDPDVTKKKDQPMP